MRRGRLLVRSKPRHLSTSTTDSKGLRQGLLRPLLMCSGESTSDMNTYGSIDHDSAALFVPGSAGCYFVLFVKSICTEGSPLTILMPAPR
jgi:hypothetical protein